VGETTGITWTNSTLNPIIGCQRVSPGCQLCYAEVQDARGRWDGGRTHWGPTAPRYRTSRSTWNQALRWNRAAEKLKKRHLVFCASLSDVFEDHPLWTDVRPELFALIRATPALTWLVLTKRPENIARLWPATMPEVYRADGGPSTAMRCPPPGAKAWPNVWLGTTAEDQQRANERLPELLAVEAALHWVSAEPLLERVDLTPWLNLDAGMPPTWPCVRWVIAGGESDVGATAEARPFDLQWARDLGAQCSAAGAAFFMKQKGSTVLDRGEPISCLGKGDEPALWPPELQRQEFPAARAA
jgi:protein gp37